MCTNNLRGGGRFGGRVPAVAVAVLLFLLASASAAAGPPPWGSDQRRVRDSVIRFGSANAAASVWDWRYHDCGDFRVAVWNNGMVGGFGPREWLIFPFRPSNIPAYRMEFISGNYYLTDLGPMFGCIRGLDTLVSGFSSFEPIRARSTDPDSPDFDPAAKAKQEYYSVYSDTAYNQWDEIDPRGNRAIGVEVHQSSYSWDDLYNHRSVIVDAWFVNISDQTIEQGCVGLLGGTDVIQGRWNWDGGPGWVPDDICGFIQILPGVASGIADTLNLVWAADNDGEPSRKTGEYDYLSPTGVLGVRLLRSPDSSRVSFNWWGWWGPSRQKSPTETGPGEWGAYLWGDRNRYKRMTNGEVDYDQPYSWMDYSADGWNPPLEDESDRARIAQGTFVNFLLSCGPLPTIAPGDSVPFTYAIVMGADFHTDPHNFADNFRYYNPTPYLNRLDFSDLISNARWAEWIFDNPGVDTDSDGYRGPFHVVCAEDGSACDTIYYRGDGIPDFRGPQPPVGPEFTLATQPHKAIVRWNGATTEYAHDPLSRKTDWEGYHVYASKTTNPDDFALAASWDKEDYKRFSYRPLRNDWSQSSDPLTVAEWQVLLGDPGFDPQVHPLPSFESAYRDTVVDTIRNVQQQIMDIIRRERLSYFVPEDANNGNTFTAGGQTEINLIQRVGERDTVVNGKPCTYGVFEFTLDNLLSATPLYFSVTTVDWGDYARLVGPMESPVGFRPAFGFPLYSSDAVIDSGLQVSVYPNPYKIRFRDLYGNWTSYEAQGYEKPGRGTEEERNRRIWFINLPDTAEINIYTLDGDLVRKILHPDPFLTTYSSVVGWDLISRNTQAVTSGIYIWRVDSRLGRQIGKLVIIK